MSLVRVLGTEHREQDFALDPEIVSALWAMEERHFWHRARNRWILQELTRAGIRAPSSFLEVGCGSGAVSGFLQGQGYAVTGVDTAEPLVERAHQRFPGARFAVADVVVLPAELQGPYDALGLFDVLEHLDDPRSLLMASLRWCKPGAFVIVTVPALGALTSVIDDLSGHKRRYEPGEVAALLSSAGLVQPTERAIFRCTSPALRASRARLPTRVDASDRATAKAIMARNLRVPPAPLNALMGWACAIERALTRGRGARGPTLLATARLP